MRINILRLSISSANLLAVFIFIASCSASREGEKENSFLNAKEEPKKPFTVSLDGSWFFATDEKNKGEQEQWFSENYDDSSWKVLEAGKSWERQGVDHYGWGWYRKQIFVPKEYSSVPLTLTLGEIPTDDTVWFNGQLIGGMSGQYKYKNWITRSYTVPSELIRYGEENTIALRIWGGDIGFIGKNSGLAKGPYRAELDPYRVFMRKPGGKAVPAELFDLSDAQHGSPFEMVFRLPPDIAERPESTLDYRITDFLDNEIQSGTIPIPPSPESKKHDQVVVDIDRQTAQTIYFRGRLQIDLTVKNSAGKSLYSHKHRLDQLSFAKRDNKILPALPETFEETPYGSLKLIDEIDLSTSLSDDPHPYMQSGFEHSQDGVTPGSPVDVHVKEILGKQARESEFGWFAYRIGRGKLKPHSTYLLRIEYPEDKPRYAPVGIHTGKTFMDLGWKNGLGTEDVYDPWPLSQQWEWYDVIVPLGEETIGTGGTESASARNGFWVYFLNKLNKKNFALYSGGPAVAQMKLYEIDPEKNAPVINKPKGLPHRLMTLDVEREADQKPSDIVHYSKLMGYNALSPAIIKWGDMNWSEPLNGYTSINIDDRNYWVNKQYDPANDIEAESPVPDKPSPHLKYLEATSGSGIDYIPRVEWGGSQDLPEEAVALDPDGNPVEPSRFGQYGPSSNLLHPATWKDLEKLMDHLIKPYVKDNPQLTGVNWRIRGQRLPISYSKSDLEMFAKETGTKISTDKLRKLVVDGMKEKYEDWWHQKRAEFHIQLANLLKSYDPEMTLYYFNWDTDKIGILLPDLTAWGGVLAKVGKAETHEAAKTIYEKEQQERKSFTADDYIEAVRTGNLGQGLYGFERADLGIRPDLYKGEEGIQLFAPAHWLPYANKPEYLDYFKTADGLAVSNVMSYDEVGHKSINPKYSANMVTPAGGEFSMALELLAYFHGDARTLNYTTYTFGRGFADAHRRFAQAFLALPAIDGTIVENSDDDVKIRIYPSENGTYVGVANKGYESKEITVNIPNVWDGKPKVKDLVSGKMIPVTLSGSRDELQFRLNSGPMKLNAFLVE